MRRKPLSEKVQYLRLSAIYRLGRRKQLPKETLVDLLSNRAQYREQDAKAIVSHWWGSLPYKIARGEAIAWE